MKQTSVTMALALLAIYTWTACGPRPGINREQEDVYASQQQMRVIHSEITKVALTNETGTVMEWTSELAKLKGVNFLKCYKNSNAWLCINSDPRCFETNPPDPNAIVMYVPIRFLSTDTNSSFVIALLASGNLTNLAVLPTWKPVPVWQLFSK